MTTLAARAHHAQPGLLARIGAEIAFFFKLISNVGPLMTEVQRLNRTSDEQLAARGTNRTAEVTRIFAAHSPS